jgi:hypothetical protein
VVFYYVMFHCLDVSKLSDVYCVYLWALHIACATLLPEYRGNIINHCHAHNGQCLKKMLSL